MKPSRINLPEMKLVGITVRTRNSLEMDPTTAQIPAAIQKYFRNNLAEKIAYRKKPGVAYCVYTQYESDCTGSYTYFIGEEVSPQSGYQTDLYLLTIPQQVYAKHTFGPGALPELVMSSWQKIWQMSPSELGGVRSYIADFEMYDNRASDCNNSCFDIFIGVNPL